MADNMGDNNSYCYCRDIDYKSDIIMNGPEKYAEEFITKKFPDANSKDVFLLMKGFIAGFTIGEDLRMRRVSPYEWIIEIISHYYDIPIETMKQKTRKREIVQARQISYYFGNNYTNLSFYSLGKFFDQDHATALHGIKSINNLIFSNRDIRREINELETRIAEKLK